MSASQDYAAFMTRYFPTFICTFFLSLFSLACAVTLWTDTHLRNHPDNSAYSVGLMASSIVLLCLGNFLIIRGRAWSVWLLVGLLLLSLLTVISLFDERISKGLFAFALLLPLLAGLMLNGKRHRQMREYLVELREKRQNH
ncbi:MULTISPECIES: hypothetical protein [Pseudomonas]|uniref:Uncharacterized protein n=1 Tax=Pseudomonas fluorescens TaxID=294 RepID=A0A5E6T971_PSEFL|nr:MULTISPECIES: hypothetical protein [Pseudomonas]VVM86255.1 hypothetical protein PS652_02545 [Pseudomonas fluorescens]